MKAIEPKFFASKAEADYARYLELRKRAGQIRHWDYEAIKIVLGKGAAYTPDFLVITLDDELEIHEYKGHWREAARVRIKCAASRIWWARFYAVTGKPPYQFELIESTAGGATLEV